MKSVPKNVINKVERMSRLMQQIVELNIEVENWMESNGVSDAFDFSYDYRDDRGYGIRDAAEYVSAITDAIN